MKAIKELLILTPLLLMGLLVGTACDDDEENNNGHEDNEENNNGHEDDEENNNGQAALLQELAGEYTGMVNDKYTIRLYDGEFEISTTIDTTLAVESYTITAGSNNTADTRIVWKIMDNDTVPPTITTSTLRATLRNFKRTGGVIQYDMEIIDVTTKEDEDGTAVTVDEESVTEISNGNFTAIRKTTLTNIPGFESGEAKATIRIHDTRKK